ncbi:hypothetical protein D3C84_498180 [compost metagenome]
MGDDGGEHIGQVDILGVLRRAVDLGGRVLARQRLADQLEVFGVLEPDLLGQRLLGGGVGQLAEARLLAGGRMPEYAVGHRDLLRRYPPALGRRGHQHGAGGGPGVAQLLPGVGDGAAAASALHRPPTQVVVAADIGGRAFHTHLRPGRVQLFGDDSRQAGIGSLAHFQVFGDHGDAIVFSDAQEGVGFEGLRLAGNGAALGQGPGKIQGQGQAGSSALQEAAAALILDGTAHRYPLGFRPATWPLRGWRRECAHRWRNGRHCLPSPDRYRRPRARDCLRAGPRHS